jgi:hypothetical protein
MWRGVGENDPGHIRFGARAVEFLVIWGAIAILSGLFTGNSFSLLFRVFPQRKKD